MTWCLQEVIIQKQSETETDQVEAILFFHSTMRFTKHVLWVLLFSTLDSAQSSFLLKQEILKKNKKQLRCRLKEAFHRICMQGDLLQRLLRAHKQPDRAF